MIRDEKIVNEVNHTFIENKIFINFLKIALVIVFLLCGFELFYGFTDKFVWDDSLMFIRYADNLVHFGRLSWNPTLETGTYGLTSPLYLIVVIPLRFLFGFEPSETMIYSSLLCGLLFFVLLWLFLQKCIDGNKKLKLFSILIVFFVIGAGGIDSWPLLFESGMDTTFAMVFLTGYFFLFKWQIASEAKYPMILTGIMGGLAYYVRPDLLLFTFMIPFCYFLLSNQKKKIASIIIITSFVFALELLLSYLFLNSPLPLAFFAKGLKMYGQFFTEKYRYVPKVEFFLYLYYYGALFFLIGANLFINRKDLKNHLDAFDKSLLLSTGVFICYYLFFVVVQVMYYKQRFYYPTLPALAYLACKSMIQIVPSILERRKKVFRLVCILGVALGLMTAVASVMSLDFSKSYVWFNKFNLEEGVRSRHAWQGIVEFSQFPEDLVIATTEVGYSSVIAKDQVVVDLAGLNETTIAHKGFNADYVFNKYKPDILYIPHPDYVDMIKNIFSNQYFNQNYHLYSTDGLTLAISSKSKYYSQLIDILYSKGIKETNDYIIGTYDKHYKCEGDIPVWLQKLEGIGIYDMKS